MSYKVTIAYTQPVADTQVELENGVCATFEPNNSYIDTAKYAGTVYDTNVDGNGAIVDVEPFASTSIPSGSPLLQFKLAAIGTDNKVEFTVDNADDAFYYRTIGEQLKDQGFKVTVDEVKE